MWFLCYKGSMKIDLLRAYGVVPVVVFYIATLVILPLFSNFVTLGKKEEYIFHDKFVEEIICHNFESC